MAKKYIDADRLKAAIERQKGYISVTHFAEELLSLIDSLQQEQSCDTCSNDKGCVTCKDGELWEGKEQTSEDLEEENVGVYEKTCWKCGTKFLYVSEAIKHDRDGDYVVCPTCDALVVHLEIPKKEEKK